MAATFRLKRKSIKIPGAVSLGTSCQQPSECCEDVVTPGTYDCVTNNITMDTSVIMTLSGQVASAHSGELAVYSQGNLLSACGVDYYEGQLEVIRAWAHGSYQLDYIGQFTGAEILGGFESKCNYHIYAYSKTPILPGFIGTSTRLESSNPLDCCGAAPHLYYNETNDDYELNPLIGTYDYSLCGEPAGTLNLPCDIEALRFDCDAPGFADYQWLSQNLIDECIGDACTPPNVPIANSDVYAGLYCDVGTSKVAQYPFRTTFTVYKQAIFWVPHHLTETALCCTQGGMILQTYVVRRRWYNDGSTLIRAEPTVLTYSVTTENLLGDGMVFEGNGTLDSSGVGVSYCVISPCESVLNSVAIEING